MCLKSTTREHTFFLKIEYADSPLAKGVVKTLKRLNKNSQALSKKENLGDNTVECSSSPWRWCEKYTQNYSRSVTQLDSVGFSFPRREDCAHVKCDVTLCGAKFPCFGSISTAVTLAQLSVLTITLLGLRDFLLFDFSPFQIKS